MSGQVIHLPVTTSSRDELIDKIRSILDVSDEICEHTAERIIAKLRLLPLDEVESIADTLLLRLHDAICESFQDEVSRKTCVLSEHLAVV
jgi:predicted sugar kinase